MKQTQHRFVCLAIGLLLALFTPACADSGTAPEPPVAPLPPADTTAAPQLPAVGTATTLDVAAWNVEWFGSVANGPTNETLQLQNVRAVIRGADVDLWGLAEIVDRNHWETLKSQLPDYAGILASDAVVAGGSAYYEPGEQKVALLYKRSLATLREARIILTGNDYEFAGRPPLEIRLGVTLNGVAEEWIVIVLHAKAFNDESSRQRRESASAALKTYLDGTYPTQKVLVIGDWNDDVDTSITPGRASPYRNFVADSTHYRFPTAALSAAGTSSTVRYPDLIDHHLNSDEVATTYVPGSATVYRADRDVPNYEATTSDHFPVVTRYTVGGANRR